MGSDQKDNWRADFRATEDLRRDAALSVSAAERLRWLEQALAFAAKVGALRRRDDDPAPHRR